MTIITLAIAGGVLIMFSVMFYLEDRDDVGIYDPDPRPRKRK